MTRSVLITGGAGFIGSHLAENLLAEGDWNVTIIDDLNDFYSPEIKRANLDAIREKGDINFFEVDIRSPEDLKPVFDENEFDVLVHLAARAGVRPSLKEPKLYAETNINGTLNLLELARDYEIKQFVFGSSSSVYGENEKLPFAEVDPIFHPISPYAATKAAGELICHTYTHLFDIRTVCLRFFTVYGARQRPDLAIHKFSQRIRDAKPI
jgi:UDP-glucuronate 4-epimerase